MNPIQIKKSLEAFLIEDLGTGDLSSQAVFSPEEISEGTFLLKEDGIICGLSIAPIVYALLGGEVLFQPLVEEGSFQRKGTPLARVKGPIQVLLSAERLILNLWQRMSGIATATHQAVTVLADPSIRICDTRKTAPGLRIFDKYAVTQGGGFNHRVGLYDGVMLKDNHIAYAGSVTKAVQKVKDTCGHMVKIEVEVETLSAFKEAVAAKADIIMLDNRSPEEIKEFLPFNKGSIIEVSGGISLENLAEYRGCGADYISLGYLTHSVKALDISFNSGDGAK
jgi:nicotinate-nucleotide pyrophosphorylase (carboxylating)